MRTGEFGHVRPCVTSCEFNKPYHKLLHTERRGGDYWAPFYLFLVPGSHAALQKTHKNKGQDNGCCHYLRCCSLPQPLWLHCPAPRSQNPHQRHACFFTYKLQASSYFLSALPLTSSCSPPSAKLLAVCSLHIKKICVHWTFRCHVTCVRFSNTQGNMSDYMLIRFS